MSGEERIEVSSEFTGKGYKLISAAGPEAGREIYVGNIPGRKQVCLYEIDGNKAHVLAYFKNHDLARRALWWLDTLYGVGSIDDGKPESDSDA